MDPVDPVALARRLIDIDSTTGREGEVAAVLAQYLRERGYSVLEQPLDRGRSNVIAAVGEPRLVFSTHFDCVPPFFPSREDGGVLYGRGACDAKGILAAQVAAAERLRAAGDTRVGLLFVAGEERGSDGAMAANRIGSRSEFLINGEPTDNRLARGDARCLSRPARRGRPRGALGLSRAGRVGDRKAARRRSSRCATAPWPEDPELGTHALHDRTPLRWRRAERDPAARGSGDRLPQRRRSRRDPARAARPRRRSRVDRRSAGSAAGPPARRAGLRDRGVCVHDRHPVSQGLGDAAAARPGLDPRRAHRSRAREDRRAARRRSTCTSASPASCCCKGACPILYEFRAKSGTQIAVSATGPSKMGQALLQSDGGVGGGAGDDRHQGVDDRGIELGAAVRRDLGERLGQRPRAAIRTVVGQRIERVRHRDDAAGRAGWPRRASCSG